MIWGWADWVDGGRVVVKVFVGFEVLRAFQREAMNVDFVGLWLIFSRDGGVQISVVVCLGLNYDIRASMTVLSSRS